jgi:prepilin-type N-terminal cleavage/methylation domain-containing protein
MSTTGKSPGTGPAGLRPVPRGGRRAFTLVEIVVVLLIVALFTTMTAMAFSSSTGGTAARESAGRLLIALRYARGYAIIHGCQCRLAFSRADNSYELTCRIDPTRDRFDPIPGGRVDRLERHVQFKTLSIASRPTGDDGSDVLTFEPTGECDGAVIEVSDGRAIYTLAVAPHSGLVQLLRGPAADVPSDREDLDG